MSVFIVIGCKNTLDKSDEDYSPSYISDFFATLEEAEADAASCGYPLTEIEEILELPSSRATGGRRVLN
jgi:hypothetical protein